MKEEETVAPYGTKCCDACQCGGGCRFAQVALDQRKDIDACVHPYQGVYESDSGKVNCHGCGQVLFEPLPEEPQGGHAIGWDGCPSCPDCKQCDYDCCGGCTYDSKFHSSAQPDGGTAIGNTYSNQVCNCKGHTCTKED